MPVEIEAKLKVADLDVVRNRLKQAAAEYAGDRLEINTFFDTDDRTLLAGDRGLRVRQNREKDGSAETVTVTYKGPRQPGPMKSRDEIELDVAKASDAIHLFDALGYHRVLSFEKRRESWALLGCEVELDELPHLGKYVEIEGPDEKTIETVRTMLGLDKQPIVHASYVAMLMTHLQDNGIKDRKIVFPK